MLGLGGDKCHTLIVGYVFLQQILLSLVTFQGQPVAWLQMPGW